MKIRFTKQTCKEPRLTGRYLPKARAFFFLRERLFALTVLVLLVSAACTLPAPFVTPSVPPDIRAGNDAAGSGETPPAGVSQSWWSAVKQRIQKDEYSIVKENGGANIKDRRQAFNRAQGLRISFAREGFEAAPVGKDAQWTWGLRLLRYGFKGDLRPADEATVTVSENRIAYARGNLTEWYINDENGLEQGFTLKRRPEGEAPGEGDLLVFEMAVLGDLAAKKGSKNAREVSFVTGTGSCAVRYGHLKAFDATGKTLPARLAVSDPQTIQIRVDTQDAVYPITVDPLATTASWTKDGEGTNNYFGFSVATAGDVNGDGYSDVIVAAYGYGSNAGRAYVYHGSVSGVATTAAWTQDGEGTSNRFGSSVATAGDVNGDGYSDVIVGAYGYNGGDGRAYVYHGSASGLATDASRTINGEGAESQFGISVATAGDVNGDGYSDVIVGAHGYNGGTGRAYAYHGSASGVDTTDPWTGDGEGIINNFGYCVATAGDVNGDGYNDVIIGAYGYNSGTGRAYVYLGAASGLGTTDPLTRDGEGTNNYFGYSVATAGDVNGDGYSDVIIGAYGYNSASGRTYAYHGSASGLAATDPWTQDGEGVGDWFGYCVATAGDVNGDGYGDVIVGAYGYDDGGLINIGRAYVYHGAASGVGTTAAWTKDGEAASNNFGYSVAAAGDVNGDGYSDVIVGAYGCNSNTGRAYAYNGAASGIAATDPWTKDGEGTSNYFGFSVATAGDVNGDGYNDVIVGAFGYGSYAGRAYVYHGGSSGLATTASWTKDGEAAGRFGYSVATAGDVNGDGYSDVIVGSYGYDSYRGRTYVYHGSASGLAATAAWTKDGDAENSYFGYCVAAAGDVNGDGYGDVAVGAYNSDTGRAYAFHGSASGLVTTASWTKDTEGTGIFFGRTLAAAGDVNRDGYSDVIVGAPAYGAHKGRAYAYHGGASGLAATAAWTRDGEKDHGLFGLSVATAGDVNGDGYSDCIVGAYAYSDTGRAYVYHGSASGLATTAAWTKDGGTRTGFGRSVAAAGDVNGDGYSDVIVGAWECSSTTGRAYVYHGSASGLAATESWTADGGASYNRFGYSVAMAGDVNGDGYSDVIVGDYGDDSHRGRALVYGGNGGEGLSLVPRQRSYSSDAPILLLGESDTSNSFRLAVTGRTPFGRGKVKLQWEVKSLGTPFSGSGTQTGTAWSDTGVSGVSLSETVSGLSQDSCYHWRARLVYHPATTPFQQFSRWISPFGNGWEETDLRTNDQPTLVQMVSFSAGKCSARNCIRLTWKTASEMDTAGFHIQRSDKENGLYARITGQIIPAEGGPAFGAAYTHEDTDVTVLQTWYYKLEMIDTNGGGTLYGPVQGTVGGTGTCPDCSGTPCVIRDVTFEAGTDYDCAYDRPVRMGPGVRVQNGAGLTLQAPGIEFGPGFHAEPGSTVKARRN